MRNFSSRDGEAIFPLSRFLLLCPIALLLVVPLTGTFVLSSAAASNSTRAPAAHSHHIIGLVSSQTPNATGHNVRVAGVSSSNWGGYVAATSLTAPAAAVTAVYGSWTVQTVQSSRLATYSAQWVGIGGYFSSDHSLIQTGTSSDASGGSTSYNAWSSSCRVPRPRLV